MFHHSGVGFLHLLGFEFFIRKSGRFFPLSPRPCCFKRTDHHSAQQYQREFKLQNIALLFLSVCEEVFGRSLSSRILRSPSSSHPNPSVCSVPPFSPRTRDRFYIPESFRRNVSVSSPPRLGPSSPSPLHLSLSINKFSRFFPHLVPVRAAPLCLLRSDQQPFLRTFASDIFQTDLPHQHSLVGR